MSTISPGRPAPISSIPERFTLPSGRGHGMIFLVHKAHLGTRSLCPGSAQAWNSYTSHYGPYPYGRSPWSIPPPARRPGGDGVSHPFHVHDDELICRPACGMPEMLTIHDSPRLLVRHGRLERIRGSWLDEGIQLLFRGQAMANTTSGGSLIDFGPLRVSDIQYHASR